MEIEIKINIDVHNITENDLVMMRELRDIFSSLACELSEVEE